MKLAIKRGFNIKAIMQPIVTVLKAEEPTTVGTNAEPTTEPEPTNGSSTPQINYEDLISKARQEEKNKLYGKIKSLEDKNKTLVDTNNANLIKMGELQATIDNLTKQVESNGGVEAKELVEAKKTIATLEAQLKSFEENSVDADTLREEVKQELQAEYEVKTYRVEKVAELKGSIIPELVMGTTKEEVDQSIERAKARFEEIVGQAMVGHQTPSHRGLPPANPSSAKLVNDGNALQDLASLNPRSPEYQEARKKLGLK